MKKILLIDDDKSTLMLTSKFLSKSGFETYTADNGEEGLKKLSEINSIDLIVVDYVMPVMGGVDFCKQLRQNTNYQNLPILMLTSMSNIEDKFMGFDAGADDYLTKPFELLELQLRIESLLKRVEKFGSYNNLKDENEENSSIKINEKNYSVTINNEEKYLTSAEFDILNYLFKNPNTPISVDELLQNVMGYPPRTGNPETIRTHIKNIRSKIEKNHTDPQYVTTVPKRGYVFNV